MSLNYVFGLFQESLLLSGLAPSIVVETTSLLEVPKAIGLGVRCTSVGDKLIDHGAETVAKPVQNSHPGAQKNIPCVFKWTARYISCFS